MPYNGMREARAVTAPYSAPSTTTTTTTTNPLLLTRKRVNPHLAMVESAFRSSYLIPAVDWRAAAVLAFGGACSWLPRASIVVP
jgi:hypothetical protein